MNAVSNAVLRQDLNSFVEEVSAVDDFFIAEKVAPVYSSDVKDGQYPKFKVASGELLNPESTTRTPTGAYGRVTRQYDTDTFSTIDRGLEELVDDSQKKDIKRFFNAEVQAAKLVKRSMRLSHELRIANIYFNNGNWNTTNSLVAYTNANLATINVVGDVLNAIDRLVNKGYMPNTLIMSSNVFTRLRQTTNLQNYLRGNRPSDSQILVSQKDIAAAFGLDNCFIGRLPYNTAGKGKPASLSPVWSNTYMWVGEVMGGDLFAGGTVRTIVWNPEGGLWVTETYRDESRRSDVVRVRNHTTEKIVDGFAGELIATQYA